MHVYQGYKYEPYGGEGQQRRGGTSRAELERVYAESHRHTAAPKPEKQRDMLPFVIVVLSLLVALICVGAWAFGYDLIVPMLAMDTVLLGGYVGWRMMA